MKLVFLILAIAAGYAFGDDDEDVKCFQEKLTPCFATIYAKILGQVMMQQKVEACSIIPDGVKCLSESAKTCKLKQNFDELEKTYTDACTPGTDLNTKLVRNEDCVSKQTDSVSSCVKTDKLGPNATPEQMLEVQKQVCRQLDSIAPCVGKKVEAECGKDAAEVTQKLLSPLLKLAEPMCAEILKGAATSLLVSSYSIFFALAVALFVWMKQ